LEEVYATAQAINLVWRDALLPFLTACEKQDEIFLERDKVRHPLGEEEDVALEYQHRVIQCVL
jgi:hypothetical protein